MAMMTGRNKLSTGGFYLPVIYYKDQKYVTSCLNNGEIDYADLTK